MYTYLSRFLHHTPPHSDVNQQSSSMLSPSGLTRWSRSNQVANLPHLDTPIKSECDSYCAGRSMVEMLGVLAIIGVLSVGAIAGYSKAMNKYRLNKMLEQYNQLFGTITIHREEFIKLSPKNSFLTLYPIIYKMGEFPDGMRFENNNEKDITSYGIIVRAYDIFNHLSEVRSSTGSFLTFYIQLSNSDEQHSSSPDLLEACRNVYQYLLIPRQDDILQVQFYYHDDQGENGDNFVYGSKRCQSGKKCLKDLNISDIDTICNSAQQDRNTRLVVWF